MKKYIFLSPHYDDAVGSCGGLIARLTGAGKDVSVLTIFGGVPSGDKERYVRRRIRNNARACKILGATAENAVFLDAVYRGTFAKKQDIFTNKISEPKLLKEITDFLQENTSANDIIYAPFDFGAHADHMLVMRAAEKLKNRKVIFYENFYYDIKNNVHQDDFVKIHLTPSEQKIKIRAAKSYRELRGLKLLRHRVRWYFTKYRPYEAFDKRPLK